MDHLYGHNNITYSQIVDINSPVVVDFRTWENQIPHRLSQSRAIFYELGLIFE